MRLTHLTPKNWRNFKLADFDLQDRLFIVGPNASGKSNLLDALRIHNHPLRGPSTSVSGIDPLPSALHHPSSGGESPNLSTGSG